MDAWTNSEEKETEANTTKTNRIWGITVGILITKLFQSFHVVRKTEIWPFGKLETLGFFERFFGLLL
jgi:hypothetical protein